LVPQPAGWIECPASRPHEQATIRHLRDPRHLPGGADPPLGLPRRRRRGQSLPASLQTGKELFVTNCGTCHTLAAAGTDGNFGPDLDKLLAPTGPATDQATVKATGERVSNAIDQGVDSDTPGRMPGEILAGEQASQVADFVAQEAGK
jgi:mono/diheme cytochrome c family protein